MFFIDILQQQIVSKICLLSNRKFNLITPLITDCEKTKMLDECYILKPLILDLARALDSCKIIDFVYFKGNNTVYFEDGKTNFPPVAKVCCVVISIPSSSVGSVIITNGE